MAIYMDFSGTEGAVGFISDGEPVIPVGVSINAMPMSVKKREWELYRQFAEDNDVHFLFEDKRKIIRRRKTAGFTYLTDRLIGVA